MVRCLPCVKADAWSTFSASVAKLKTSANGARSLGRQNSFSQHVKAIKDQLRSEKQQRPNDEHPAGAVVDEVSFEDPAAPNVEWLNTVAALKEKLCAAQAQRTQLLEENEAYAQRNQELEARSNESPDYQHIVHLEEQIAIYKKRIIMLEAPSQGVCVEAVRVYPGFTEHTYRLVFPFEDRFAPDTPQLFTIVPSGVVENSKVLEPQKEKGLIAFTYPQSISDEFTGLPVAQQSSSNMDGSGNNQLLRDTAFVWHRQDGTNALVQTWPTNLNEKFRQDFQIFEGANPDSAKFQPQAVSEFQEAMVRLFGPAAASCPILFCHKKLASTSPAVVGLGEEVLAHLKEHPDLMSELAIASIDGDGLGFVADGTNGKGQKFEKHFRLTPREKCVLYRKVGWDTMGCIKPLNQFLHDAEFHEPPTLAEPVVEQNFTAANMGMQLEDAPGSAQRILELEQEVMRLKESQTQVGELEAMSAAETASYADQITELEAAVHGHAQRSAQLEAIVAELRQAEESYIQRIKELEGAAESQHSGQAAQRCLQLEEIAASHAHRSAELEALVEDLRRREEASVVRIQQMQEEAAGRTNSGAPEMEAMLETYEKRIIELEAENHSVKSVAAEQEEQLTQQIAQALGERNAHMEALVGEMQLDTLTHVAQMEQDSHAVKQLDLQQSSSEAQRASEMEAAIANMASVEQAHRERISRLEDNIATQQSSYGAQLADLEITHQTRVDELEARGSDMRQRHQEALMQISQLENDLAQRSGQHAGHVAQLEEKSRTTAQRAADLEVNKTELEAQIAEMQKAHASDIDRLHAEITASQGHRVQVELLQSELADMEGHRAQVQRLQEKLAAEQGHRAKLEREGAELAAAQAAAGAPTNSAERSDSQPSGPLTPKDGPTPSLLQAPVLSTPAFEPTTRQPPTKVVQHLQPPSGYTSGGGGAASGRSTGIRRVPSGSRSAILTEGGASTEIRGPLTPTNYSTSPTPTSNYGAVQAEVLTQRWVPGAPPQVNLTKPPNKLGTVHQLDRTRIRGAPHNSPAPLSSPPSLVPVAATATRMPQLHPQAQQASRVPRRSGGHWQQ